MLVVKLATTLLLKFLLSSLIFRTPSTPGRNPIHRRARNTSRLTDATSATTPTLTPLTLCTPPANTANNQTTTEAATTAVAVPTTATAAADTTTASDATSALAEGVTIVPPENVVRSAVGFARRKAATQRVTARRSSKKIVNGTARSLVVEGTDTSGSTSLSTKESTLIQLGMMTTLETSAPSSKTTTTTTLPSHSSWMQPHILPISLLSTRSLDKTLSIPCFLPRQMMMMESTLSFMPQKPRRSDIPMTSSTAS